MTATVSTKTIICLANSRKMSGRCIAGREFSGATIGGWIRPISSRPNHEISEEDRRYKNGQRARLLDIITIPIVGPRPNAHQVENYLIDDNFYWANNGQASTQQIRACLQSVNGPLWGIGSSYYGTNDKLDEHAAAQLGESLKLVEVNDLVVQVAVEGGQFGPAKRKVRGEFSLQKITYSLVITDPAIEERFLAGNDGNFPIGRAVLCLSLGEPLNGYVYKLIAAIILPPAI